MTQSQHDSPQTQQPAPFYRRSVFWIFIGVLLGLLAALLFSSCQANRVQTTVAVAVPEDIFSIGKARITGLEAELARLQKMLEAPCDTANTPVTPSTTTPAPEYSQASPPKTPAATPEGKPEGAPPASTQGNAVTPEDKKPAPQAAATPSTVSELMEQGTVFILSDREDGVGMGSGFPVAPGIIMTNRHVIGSPNAQVFVGNKALSGMQKAKVIAFSETPARDYALLRISDESAKKIPVLKMADGAKRMARISAWGYPAFITAADPKLKALLNGDFSHVPEVVYTEGAVSVVFDKQPPYIVHTALLSQGNSGGPLINEKGVVVGINTLIQMAGGDSYGQSGVALPGADIVRFLSENGIPISSVGE